MDSAVFRKIVDEVLGAVPEKWAKIISNVAILIEDEPDEATLRENGINPNEGTLLGLYRGIPRTERGSDYGVGETLPDTITLYRLPILDTTQGDEKSVTKVIRETVWHEIAHYFGMKEGDVRHRESDGTNRYTNT